MFKTLSILSILLSFNAYAVLTPVLVNTGAVDSVNGETGAVTLDSDDIDEGVTNLYFTTTRAKNACVADAINNGTLDVAASQNAVFDALALKADGAASSVDSEVALFSGTGGKALKRASGSGYAKLTSGVLSSSSTVPFADQLSIPLASTYYVDKNRADSYTEDGTISRPYKTIMGAINAIKAANASPSALYVVGAGTYVENVTWNTIGNVQQFFFHCAKQVDINPASGLSFDSSTSNANIDVLIIDGCKFSDDVNIAGSDDNANIAATDMSIYNGIFIGNLTIKNLVGAAVHESHMFGNVTFENMGAGLGAIVGGLGMGGGLLSIVTNNANPKPSGFSQTIVIAEKTLLPGPVTVDSGSSFQIREGVRMGAPGQDVTINGILTSYGGFIRGNILLGSGSVWTNNATFYDPALVTDSGATFTNNTKLVAASADIAADVIRLRTAKTPASASATCTQGQIAWDSGFIYVCTATDTWKRSAIATW